MVGRPVGRRHPDRQHRRPSSGRRHLLLPALHAVNDRVGWVSQGGLNDVVPRLLVPPAEAYGVATFYGLFSTDAPPAAGRCTCARPRVPAVASGALADAGPEGEPTPTGRPLASSPCLGVCERAPAALVVEAGRQPSAGDRTGERRRHRRRRGGAVRRHGRGPARSLGAPGRRSVARAPAPGRCASTRRASPPTALTVATRRSAVRSLLARPACSASCTDSRSCSVGAAPRSPPGASGRPSPASPCHPHDLVCNADESEPGTFKDRVLMEGDPFARRRGHDRRRPSPSGASRATSTSGASTRWPGQRLQHAIDECRASGYLGDDVMGRGLRLRRRDLPRCRRLHLRRGDRDLQLDRGRPR